jgi:hypothetical protein
VSRHKTYLAASPTQIYEGHQQTKFPVISIQGFKVPFYFQMQVIAVKTLRVHSNRKNDNVSVLVDDNLKYVVSTSLHSELWRPQIPTHIYYSAISLGGTLHSSYHLYTNIANSGSCCITMLVALSHQNSSKSRCICPDYCCCCLWQPRMYWIW